MMTINNYEMNNIHAIKQYNNKYEMKRRTTVTMKMSNNTVTN